MSTAPSVHAAHTTGPLDPGTVLVADTLLRADGTALPCPAAVLVEGEVRRRGGRTVRGPLRIGPPAGAPEGSGTGPAVLPGADAGAAAFGAAACDERGSDAARAAVEAWSAVCGRPRELLLATPRSFCAGVDRAVEIVERALEQRGAPVHVRKQIVHNRHVVADLEQRGAVFVDELDAVPDGATVVFSAHGVSPAVREEAGRRGLDVIDATCPLVTKVHSEARRFAARGDTVVLVGHAGHEEVEGTLGEAPGRTVLVQTPEEAARLRVEDPERVSYLTQTTLAVDEAAEVVEALRARFPSLRGPGSDDICYATTNRQDALVRVAGRADLVLVVGSDNSSNSLRLVELARRHGARAHLVDDARDIRPAWLDGVSAIGLTAGASAPHHLVEEAVDALAGLGPVTVSEHGTVRETVTFTLPLQVRSP
ncbi:4-hydroxy-3-methylbut-2-enyl diphosphate reductase [Nocardiopsis algeriensis]|uniref:4-hydroxy-3-methylbut-2-enyl diphosphate reductase n=1 Tax=Nocardiopsis algeriensis TaxID=1478215 RepID=UPI003B4288D1